MQKVHPIRFPLLDRAVSTRTALLAGLSLATAVLGGCGANVDSSIDDTASAAGSGKVASAAGPNNAASAAGSNNAAGAAGSANAAGAAGSNNAASAAGSANVATPASTLAITGPSGINEEVTAFNWFQGWGTVNMESWSTHVCVMSRISGSFRGAGESVRIFKGSNGLWQMDGTSAQAGVLITSHCFPLSVFTANGSIVRWISDEFVAQAQAWDYCNWILCTRNSGSAFTNMWESDSMAFLTGVGGAFDGEGEAAWADPESARVHALTSADVTNYLTARAHNFFVGVPHSGHVPKFWGPVVPYRGSVNEVRGYSAGHYREGVGETWLAATNDAMCFITSIQGGFWGNGEIVEMVAEYDGPTLRWKLRVTNGTNSNLSAGAYCYAFDQN
jgi:hypothetical protein